MISMTTAVTAMAIFAVIAALLITAAYGQGHHRGHVSGFHEGLDVARDDIKSIDRMYHTWHMQCVTPHFPCTLVISMNTAPGESAIRIQEFESKEQWNEYLKLADDSLLWYDILRIAPRN